MMGDFSAFSRNQLIQVMCNTEYDLLVIGGGITGAGIALDAVSRGLKVALVEMQDFAAGTSSRSTKLIHGGLRYLKQFEIKEVADLGKERAIVYENGPHVTTPEWMILPFHKGGTFGKFTTAIGLTIYDYLAGVKKTERKTMLTREETLEKVPYIKEDGLLGSGFYVEYRTDDARLTIEVMKAAHERGAHIMNYVKADSFIYDQGIIVGVNIVDLISNSHHVIRARKVVNAAGPWVDEVRKKEGTIEEKHLKLSKGVHLVFDQTTFPLSQSVYFDTPDGRMVFAIPREGKTYVGTTDTFYDGDPGELHVTREDCTYILNAIHYMFPDIKLTDSDIESSWAGVRPLIHEEGKGPSEVSRKDEIWESDTGLITIAGGKLTGYRKMAEKVVNLIVHQLGKATSPCITKKLRISGGDVGGSAQLDSFLEEKAQEAESFGLTKEDSYKLAKLYGTNVDKVLSYLTNNEGSNLPPSLHAQLLYSIHHEMVVKPTDFFLRRTGYLLFDMQKVDKWKHKIIEEMAMIFNWTDEEKSHYVEDLNEEIARATTFK